MRNAADDPTSNASSTHAVRSANSVILAEQA